MTKIYIVIKATGEYEDYRTRKVYVAYERSKCDNYITEKQSAYCLRSERYKAVQTWLRTWGEHNPEPERPEFLKRPRWPSGLCKEEISVGMRAERERVDDWNKRLGEKYEETLNEYYERRDAAMKEFAYTILGITDDNLIQGIDRYEEEPSYSIQEMEIAE
jgi:hypothetical protein